jgi:hypothetical protein
MSRSIFASDGNDNERRIEARRNTWGGECTVIQKWELRQFPKAYTLAKLRQWRWNQKARRDLVN